MYGEHNTIQKISSSQHKGKKIKKCYRELNNNKT